MHIDDLTRDILESAIHFHHEDGSTGIEDFTAIRNWLLNIIELEKGTLSTLNYIFCSDAYLHKINVDYLQHDTYTDIITFQYEPDIVGGDIFISTERVQENAVANHVSFLNELHRVMVHGVLHMLGYKDKTVEEQQIMRSKEDFYLERVGLLL